MQPAPGSELVWDNATNTLLPCTTGARGGQTLCPAGEPPEQLPLLQPLQPPPPAAAQASPPLGQRRQLRSRNLRAQPAAGAGLGAGSATAAAGQAAVLVNRSPQLTAVSLTGVISSRATPLAQLRAYLLLTHLAAPPAAAAVGIDGSNGTTGGNSGTGSGSSSSGGAALPPIRTSQLMDAASGAGSAFVAPAGGAGLAALAAEAVRVTAAATQHTNAGWQESLPAVAAIRCVYDFASASPSGCCFPSSAGGGSCCGTAHSAALFEVS